MPRSLIGKEGKRKVIGSYGIFGKENVTFKVFSEVILVDESFPLSRDEKGRDQGRWDE